MENEALPVPKQRLNALSRVLRRGRIFARLREGWAYDDIAREEKLTAERVRQIVREALDRRPLDEETDHAKLQLARLQAAMRIASEAVSGGDVTAIAPLLKVLDRLDRYQRTAKINEVHDVDSRKKLLDKLNRVAGNLGLAVIEDPAKAKPAPTPAPDEPKGPPAEKEKSPWGVGASP